MLPDKKKLAMIIGIGHADKEPEDTESADEGPDDLHAIAEEILGAVHEEDPKALAEALKSFFDCCSCAPEEESVEE